MRIGELAARAGTTTRALRYYEARGLLPARRGGNGYRTYDEGDLKLLRQIRTLQDFGFDLEETNSSTPLETKRTVRLWTDDYSNLFQILK